MTNYKKIGERLKRIRRENNLTQEKLAEMAEVDPKSVIEIENGKRNLTIKTLSKLASALKVSISDILE